MEDLLEEGFGNILDAINDLFGDSGKWVADLLNSGAKAYNKFIAFAFKLVTKDLSDSSFDKFWEIIDFMNSVFVLVSSTLLVMFFFYTLYESSVESKAEINMYRTVFDYVKLFFCNYLVANSLNIVIGIFKIGTIIATKAVRTGDINANIVDENAGLAQGDIEIFEKGVSGLSGFLVVIMAVIGAVVMIACAIVIIMEIVTRFYKIFCIIPFASLSFTTFVLPDGKGNEIFRGYIKNTIILSLEAAIIVFCIALSNVLIGSSAEEDSLVSSIFDMDDELNFQTVELNSEDEVYKFTQYCRTTLQYKRLNGILSSADIEEPSITSDYDLGDFDYYYIVPGDVTIATPSEDAVTDAASGVLSGYMTYEYPVCGCVGSNLGLGAALLLVVKCALPMILAAATVKEVPSYISAKILGS